LPKVHRKVPAPLIHFPHLPHCQVTENFVDVDGCRVRYLRAGAGPPLVLVHGLLGYSFSWRYNIPALAQHRTVYALDLPGMGFSERKQGLDVSFRASASRLHRFMSAVGIGAAELVGSSHGGALAMVAASLDPDRIRQLVLVSPVNPWSSQGVLLTRVLSLLGAAAFRCVYSLVRIRGRKHLEAMYGDPRRIPPGTLEGYAAPLAVTGTCEHLHRVVCGWQDGVRQVLGALPTIAHIPTFLIWGELDRAVYPQSAYSLYRHFKSARLHIFRGAGHIPYEEVPWEFNRAVVNFLATRMLKASY